MKKFKGHSLPDDLFYLLLSYNDETNWQWFKDNNLTEPSDIGFKLKETLSKEQLDNLIKNAIDFNLNLIQYNA